MSRIVIDGYFLTERINGVQRYGIEIVKMIDKMVSGTDLEMEIAVPESYHGILPLNNIPIVKVGKRSGKSWEQLDLASYLRKNKAKVICFENIVPLFYRHGIAVIHDISFKVNPDFFDFSLRGKCSIMWRRLNYLAAFHSNMHIVTDSEFSKKEILKYYNVDTSRITVAGCGWQHMMAVDRDDSIFEEYPEVEKGRYFFALATLAKGKNFKWIVNAAKHNPDKQFVIAGGGNKEAFLEENKAEDLDNIILTGYISDERAKSMMSECRGFLFPTLYEGFGLPPMEALAAGAESIIVSDTETMHEVYENAAYYIDPYDEAPVIREIKKADEKTKKKLFDKYSWEKSAGKILERIKGLNG